MQLAVPPRVIELAGEISAGDPIKAADTALRSFRRSIVASLGEAPFAPHHVSVELATGYGGGRAEVVSGAEIARRLGVSRERVRQLAEEPGRFPAPIGMTGKSRAWRWGDIADWTSGGGRRGPGRPRSTER